MIVEQPQEVQELPEYQRLIEVGNERGTLAFGEIVEALAEHELEPEAMDAVKGMIEAEGIEIIEDNDRPAEPTALERRLAYEGTTKRAAGASPPPPPPPPPPPLLPKTRKAGKCRA